MSLFDLFTDPIENALDLTGDLISGEDISSKQVAKLISAGLTVAMVAEATGLTIEAVEKLLED